MINKIWSECGTEFTNKTFDTYLYECGIKHEYHAIKTSQQNGVDRINMSLIEVSQTMQLIQTFINVFEQNQ